MLVLNHEPSGVCVCVCNQSVTTIKTAKAQALKVVVGRLSKGYKCDTVAYTYSREQLSSASLWELPHLHTCLK